VRGGKPQGLPLLLWLRREGEGTGVDEGPADAAVDVLVIGRVQGVGFRYFAHATATRLGLVGYVRNRLDGSVQAYAEGARGTLEAFVGELGRGCPGSRVERVHAAWGTPGGEYTRFSIESTR